MSGDFKIFAHVVKKAVPTITEEPCAAADAVFFFQPAGLIFLDRKYLCREILLNAKFAIFKPAAFAQCIGNVLLRNVLAGCVNDGLVPLFGFLVPLPGGSGAPKACGIYFTMLKVVAVVPPIVPLYKSSKPLENRAFWPKWNKGNSGNKTFKKVSDKGVQHSVYTVYRGI
jgi:hypothetical protein